MRQPNHDSRRGSALQIWQRARKPSGRTAICASRLLFVVVASCASLVLTAGAQSYSSSLHDSLRWCMIAPQRGGRTVGAPAVPAQPNVFSIGVNNGGVWKISDNGRVWQPRFDES